MIYVIDLFCGAGGTTTGIERAKLFGKRVSKVIACVNHDPLAIQSHKVNHKKVWHFIEDIRTLEVSKLVSLINQYKRKDPQAVFIVWASLECTNLSIAKGSVSRDPDSRTLCDHMYRYVEALSPDYFWIENVREFRTNGPLRLKCSVSLEDRSELAVDNKGKLIYLPNAEHKGEFFEAWKKAICAYGYHYEDRDLNSADFGEFTKRIRYYAQFAKNGLPIVWPTPTHTKVPLEGSRLKKWKAVKDVLDFTVEGKSLFNRKKALSPRTMERIYAGLIKYVAGGEKAFIQQRNSGLASSKVVSVNAPCRTLTSTGGNLNLVTIEPLTTANKYSIGEHYSNRCNHQSIDAPAGTITTKDHYSLIKSEYFIDRQFSHGGRHQSIEDPAGALLTVPKMSLIKVEASVVRRVMDTNYNNAGGAIDQPPPTILSCRELDLIPADTFVQGPGIIVFDKEIQQAIIPILKCDCDATVRVKMFMADYGISDILSRMFIIPELKRIQGFPENYYLAGPQVSQKKFIGNSVTPGVPKVMIQATAKKLSKMLDYKNLRMAA